MSIKACVRAAAGAFGVEPHKLRNRSRRRVYAWPRFAAMWLARMEGYSYARIGEVVNRDHSAVYAGCQRARELIDADEDFGDAALMAYLALRNGSA